MPSRTTGHSYTSTSNHPDFGWFPRKNRPMSPSASEQTEPSYVESPHRHRRHSQMGVEAKETKKPSRKAKRKPSEPQEPGPWSVWIPHAQDARFFYRARLKPDGEYEYEFSEGYSLATSRTMPVYTYTMPSPPAPTMPYVGITADWQTTDAGPPETAMAPIPETLDRAQDYAPQNAVALVRRPPPLAGKDDKFSPSMAVVPAGRRETDHHRPKRPRQPTFLMIAPWFAHSKKLGNKVKSEKEINVHSNNRVKVWLKDIDVAEPGLVEWDRLSS
ncbi:hypothetical protein B0T19DRAFT_169633 [Cercophora scortea]|uniref:Uncharacterized protein n=1 Tax=Cercophora scortea TaxID=314031 RepID=A0AAE0IM96_9PEZI|nr:hypothetical protein B0T19DRAFT_169633 [Cercophora scortea]